MFGFSMVEAIPMLPPSLWGIRGMKAANEFTTPGTSAHSRRFAAAGRDAPGDPPQLHKTNHYIW
jgi:hypothetical protein